MSWCSLLGGRGSQVDYGASLENWFPPGTEGSNPSPCAFCLVCVVVCRWVGVVCVGFVAGVFVPC